MNTAVTIVIPLLSVFASLAAAQQDIPRFVVSCGGSTMTSASFTLRGTVGQAEAGYATSASYSLVSGFWNHCNTASACPQMSFVAIPGPGRVLLHWTTAIETGLSGYAIDRATNLAGPYMPVTRVTAAGLRTYDHLDTAATYGQTYTYRLFEQFGAWPAVLRATATAKPYGFGLPPNVARVGVNGNYSTIGAAIAAASGPDCTIALEPGTYPAFSISPGVFGSLRVIGDGTGAVIIDAAAGPVSIQGTVLAQTVELRGLQVLGSATSSAILVQGCQGPVILDSLNVQGGAGQPAVRVVSSPSVAIQRTDLTGSPGLNADSASVVYASHGAIDAVVLSGGSAVTLCQVIPGTVSASPNSTLSQLLGPMPDVRLLPFFTTGASLNLSFTAAPTVPWVLALALGNQWTPLPPLSVDMIMLLDVTTLVICYQSTTDASGRDGFSLFVPAQAGFEGVPLMVQTLSFDPTSGHLRCSNVTSMVGLP